VIINLANQLTQSQGIQQTYTAGTVTPGGTFAPIKNSDGLQPNWALQIGQTGEETAEIMIGASTSGSVVNFGTSPSHPAGTLLFGHNQDTPIYQIHYDQLVLNRSTTGTIGPFSPIATVSLQPDSQYTQYNDASGAAGYAYFGQYYNSVNGDLSGSSAIFLPGGPTFWSLQKIRSRTKDKLYSAGYIRDDTIITDWINEWLEQLVNSAIKVNQGYMLGTAQYGFGTAGLGTITDPYFKQAVKLEVTWDGVTYIPSTKIEVRAFTESDYFNMNAPRHAWLGETAFEILPHTQAGTVKMTYAQRFVPLTNDTDELPQTLKGYTTSFTEYCLGVAYGLDQKDAESQQHYQLAMGGKADFIQECTPRDETGAESIDIVEGISGMEEDITQTISDTVW
jgi:hypothetical protein